MSELALLPGVQSLARLLRRRSGFGLLVVAVPSRGAAEGARRAIQPTVREAGRALIPADADGAAGDVSIEVVSGPDPAERGRRYGRLNISRDRLAAQGRMLILILLEGDLPAFAEEAPDLWSVRTEIYRHAQIPPRDLEAAIPLDGDRPLPPEVDRATRFVSLQGLQVGADGRAIPAAELEGLYQDLLASAPAGTEKAPVGPQEPARELLTRYRASLLVGPAGSGKSTLLVRLARGLVASGNTVLFVRLSGFDISKINVLDLKYAYKILAEGSLWPATEPARPWLLLDGLDETGSPESRRQLVLVADDLVRVGRASGAVIGARPDALRRSEARGLTEADVEPAELEEGPESVGLPQVFLLELEDDAIKHYFERWVDVTLPAGERRAQLDALLRTVGLSGEANVRAGRLRALCRRPLFLAVVSALVWARGAHVQGEAELLEALVRSLIHRRRTAMTSAYSAEDLVDLAREVAWALKEQDAYALPTSVILTSSTLLVPSGLDALRVGTGLLDEDPHKVRFVHAALQDLLVAQVMFDRFDLQTLGPILFDDPGRNAMSRLLAEIWAARQPARFAAFLASALPREPDWATWRSAARNAVAVAALVSEIWGEQLPLHLRSQVAPLIKDSLLRVRNDVPLAEGRPGLLARRDVRRAVQLLGLLGDDRIGRLEFVPTSSGWELARWPVTNRIFRAFLEDGGYQDPRWWTLEGRRWLSRSATRRKDAPERWGVPGFSNPNQPVCGLSHHEARAFVRWWQEAHDEAVCLPARDMWFQAARKSILWERPIAVMDIITPASRPRSVGTRPWLATRDGIEDLGGLVREWLDAKDGGEPYAGFAFCDSATPLKSSGGVREGHGRRWYHPYGLRLARRI